MCADGRSAYGRYVSGDQDLSSWALRLDDAETALEVREASVQRNEPVEVRAIAEGRDKLADERDALFAALDQVAADRDLAALDRDGAASQRDQAARRSADDHDPGFGDRFLSGTDRDAAAVNRADSADDRREAADQRLRAANDRHRSAADATHATDQAEQLRKGLESRTVIGQAQGMLMQRYDVSADTAFGMLVKLSQVQHIKLRDVAGNLVAAGRL